MPPPSHVGKTRIYSCALAGIIGLRVSLAEAATIFIDNTDPRVAYSGTWSQIPSSADPQQANFNGTLAHTTQNGAFATIKFNATSVIVFGMLANTTGKVLKSRYSLDQRLPEYYEPPSIPDGHEKIRVKFWESPHLALYEHALRVENNGDEFWLDYLTVEVPDEATESISTDGPVMTSTSSTSSSSGSVSTSSIDTSTSQSTSQALNTQPSLQPSQPASTFSHTSSPTTSSTSQTAATIIFSSADNAPIRTTSQTQQSNPTWSTADAVPGTATAVDAKADTEPLTSGEIAGMAVGVGVAGQIVLAVLWWCRRRRRARSGSASSKGGAGLPGRSMEQLVPSSPPLSPLSRELFEDTHGREELPRRDRHSISGDTGTGKSRVDRSRRTRPSSTPTISSRSVNTARDQGATDIPRWTETDGGIRLAGGRPGVTNAGAVDLALVYPPPYCSTYGSGDGSGRSPTYPISSEAP